jgi:hypothetical protein
VVDRLAINREARSAVRHEALSLRASDLGAQVGLGGLAEDASGLPAIPSRLHVIASSSCTVRARVPALRCEAGNNLVTNLDRCHTRANGLHNSASLMPEDAREFSFGVLTRECIDIGMAQSIRKNLETDFSCLGRRDCDGFRLQRLVGGPGLPAPRLHRDKSLNMQKSRARTYHGCLTLNRLRLRT